MRRWRASLAALLCLAAAPALGPGLWLFTAPAAMIAGGTIAIWSEVGHHALRADITPGARTPHA